MNETPPSPGVTIRHVMRRVTRVALGTLARDGSGAPYVSLAMVALDVDATPLLFLSDLADHTRNLKADARASLLFDGTLGAAVPLAGERATIQGRVQPTDAERHRRRYLARHPDAADYLGFKDFNLYRVEVERAHLVAGFGRIYWVEGSSVLQDEAQTAALAAAEPEIVAHMNEDHADVVQLYASGLLGRSGGDWIVTGVDPDGCDLRHDSIALRLPFRQPVRNAEGARLEFVRLAKEARVKLQSE